MLAVIWEAQDFICAKRLKGVLVYPATQLARHEEIRLSPHLKAQLEAISISNIGPHLSPKTHTSSVTEIISRIPGNQF